MTIMVLTHRADLRAQIANSLETRGHQICIPDHRTDVTAKTKESHPDLVVLDMYLDNPSGARVLSDLRDNGYEGAVIAMSGPSKLVRDEHSRRLHRIVQLPVQIGTRFDLSELETAVMALHGHREANRAVNDMGVLKP